MRHTYRITIGVLILVLVISVFFSTPSMVSPGGVSLVASELEHSSGNEIFVRTRLDFANPEQMEQFPQTIGEWYSVSYDWPAMKKLLGADVLLSRVYRHPNYSNPLFFLIIQGTNMSAFHPPVICYPALGYEIVEEGTIVIPLANVSWASGPWRSELEGSVFKGEMSLKKLLMVKRSDDGRIIEKRIALYYFVKDERMSMPNEVTMIRLSAVTALNGSYQEELEQLKILAADTFPAMFEVRPEEKMVVETLILEHGVLGGVVIALLISAPIIYMLLPIIRKRKS